MGVVRNIQYTHSVTYSIIQRVNSIEKNSRQENSNNTCCSYSCIEEVSIK